MAFWTLVCWLLAVEIVGWLSDRMLQRKEEVMQAKGSRRRRGGRLFHVLRADNSGKILGITADTVDVVTAVLLVNALRRQGWIAVIRIDSSQLRRLVAAKDAHLVATQLDPRDGHNLYLAQVAAWHSVGAN